MDPSTGPERTYTVSWRDPNGIETTCTSLSPRIAFARLWAAWKAMGEITVLQVTPEWLPDRTAKTDDWPYALPKPDCSEPVLCVTNDKTGFWCNACTLWTEENAALIESGEAF